MHTTIVITADQQGFIPRKYGRTQNNLDLRSIVRQSRLCQNLDIHVHMGRDISGYHSSMSPPPLLAIHFESFINLGMQRRAHEAALAFSKRTFDWVFGMDT